MATPLPGNTRHRSRALTCAFAALALLVASATAAEHPEIAKRRSAERKSFTDAEIADGFFKIAFSAELQQQRTDRIRKYDGPVRVFIDNRARPDRSRQLVATVSDIARRVRHLDLAITDQRGEANVIVTVVRDRDLRRTIRAVFGRENERRIQRSLDPQCLSSFRKDDNFRITHSEVILVSDVGEFTFYDCAYEELLQALGPINDDSSVPWTMFNDDVHLGFFGVYDQYLLNLLYHPRIRHGMTRDEVKALLPELLPEVRAFVAQNNDLPK